MTNKNEEKGKIPLVEIVRNVIRPEQPKENREEPPNKENKEEPPNKENKEERPKKEQPKGWKACL